MDDTVNPLLPAPFDVLWFISALAGVALAGVALFVVAVITLWRSRERLSPTALMAWTAVVILLQVLGPLAWLFHLATTRSLRTASR